MELTEHRYPGGKNNAGTYHKIINRIPPIETFIEGFFGSGAITYRLRPAKRMIGIERDPAVVQAAKRNFPGVQIAQANTLEWLAANGRDFDERTLIYLDPPYLPSTLPPGAKYYRFELTEAEHGDLLSLIRGLRCCVMLSGYWSEMYAQALQGWRTFHFKAITRSGKMATEWLWMNYAEPTHLHDYRYLGENYRQRDDMKRQRKRIREKFERMPAMRRYVVLSEMAQLHDEPQAARLLATAKPPSRSTHGRDTVGRAG